MYRKMIEFAKKPDGLCVSSTWCFSSPHSIADKSWQIPCLSVGIWRGKFLEWLKNMRIGIMVHICSHSSSNGLAAIFPCCTHYNASNFQCCSPCHFVAHFLFCDANHPTCVLSLITGSKQFFSLSTTPNGCSLHGMLVGQHLSRIIFT